MLSPKLKKRLFAVAGIGCFILAVFFIWKITRLSEEYTATQSIIKNISVYRDEIESWGYQVDIFDPMKDEFADKGGMIARDILYYSLLIYKGYIYEPILILTNQDGEKWFFIMGLTNMRGKPEASS